MRQLSLATAACTLAVAGTFGPAQAQNYPSKPVSLVIGFGPGGSTDTESRLYVNHLSRLTGQTFVLDYKPGAGSTVGTAFVARAKPDGYTLMGITGGFTAAPALRKLSYDPVKDFAPISLMSRRTTLIVAYPGTPYNNLKEYIAYVKANPGKVNAGTAGLGGSPHLNMAWFHNLIDGKVTYVHYKGVAIGQADLMAGRVDVTFTTFLSAVPHLKSGKMKPLAIANLERNPLLPGLQTADEQGVKGYDYASIYGIIAPAGTPAPIINRLSGLLQKIAKEPDVVKAIEASGGMTVGSSPEVLGKAIVSELERYRKIVADNGIKLN